MKKARILSIALLLACACLVAPASAEPQQPAGQASNAEPDARSSVEWLTAYHFHLGAASIRTDDPRFSWDAHFGGDVDLADYRVGRINMVADYGVIVGSVLRTIDPNQGAYHLNLSASLRDRGIEFQALFDHVSRHLSDRPNRTAISWNALGVVATTGRQTGPLRAVFTGRATKIVQAAFVDYTWWFGAGADTEYTLSRRRSLVARGDVEPVLVDTAVAGRGTQFAAKFEGGLRLYGTGAGVELFGSLERRLDPYPLERSTRNWLLVGFRVISR